MQWVPNWSINNDTLNLFSGCHKNPNGQQNNKSKKLQIQEGFSCLHPIPPILTPQSLDLRDLPHNQQVVEFSSIPDMILSPVKTVNVFIECNVSWLWVLDCERMRGCNLAFVRINVWWESTCVFVRVCVCVHAVCLHAWMFIHGWSRLVLVRIVSDHVAIGHGGYIDNACVLCWQTGVLGPEKVNWQICTGPSASNLPYSPQANFHASQVSTVGLFSLFWITQSRDMIQPTSSLHHKSYTL